MEGKEESWRTRAFTGAAWWVIQGRDPGLSSTLETHSPPLQRTSRKHTGLKWPRRASPRGSQTWLYSTSSKEPGKTDSWALPRVLESEPRAAGLGMEFWKLPSWFWGQKRPCLAQVGVWEPLAQSSQGVWIECEVGESLMILTFCPAPKHPHSRAQGASGCGVPHTKDSQLCDPGGVT